MAVPKNVWNESKPMWVIGTIDSNGAIRSRASKSRYDCPTHGPGDGPGKRWRWNVWGQDFCPTAGLQESFNEDEYTAVMNWLDRFGYVYNR